MFKRILVISLLLVVSVSCAYAADWSKFASGRGAIKLEGSSGQRGYIEFQDGSGTVTGYLWMSSVGPRWCTAGALDLTTTKLNATNSGASMATNNAETYWAAVGYPVIE